MPFSLEGDDLHLTREGGHSARRIVHATDATGAAVQRTLIERVRQTPSITLFENHTLVDLITSDKLAAHSAPGSATVRTKLGITDLPTAHASPASLQGLKTRLNASGKRHNLPAAVATHLCELLASREDTKAVHLAALGMSSAEIRALPRFQAVDHARTRARAAAMAAEHAATADAKRQERITRKLEQSK